VCCCCRWRDDEHALEDVDTHPLRPVPASRSPLLDATPRTAHCRPAPETVGPAHLQVPAVNVHVSATGSDVVTRDDPGGEPV